jgi:hypothetical protein
VKAEDIQVWHGVEEKDLFATEAPLGPYVPQSRPPVPAPYATPEAAARSEIPERYSRVLGSAISPDDRRAFVLLGTNEPPQLYPYLVHCWHDDGGWEEGSSSNGNMTCANGKVDSGDSLFDRAVWDEAPSNADFVTVRVGTDEKELPVVDGYYLFVKWDTADEPRTSPTVVSSRSA